MKNDNFAGLIFQKTSYSFTCEAMFEHIDVKVS